jgi:hypothetical protein
MSNTSEFNVQNLLDDSLACDVTTYSVVVIVCLDSQLNSRSSKFYPCRSIIATATKK